MLFRHTKSNGQRAVTRGANAILKARFLFTGARLLSLSFVTGGHFLHHLRRRRARLQEMFRSVRTQFGEG
jgi:hypothetical protein